MMAPTLYRIRVQGHLRLEWSEWFDDMTITLEENGDTTLSGLVADQPALHGLLIKVRDLGLTLISVSQVKPGSGPEMASESSKEAK
jgi:hypothetical protein